jgi:hypothetical protein
MRHEPQQNRFLYFEIIEMPGEARSPAKKDVVFLDN